VSTDVERRRIEKDDTRVAAHMMRPELPLHQLHRREDGRSGIRCKTTASRMDVGAFWEPRTHDAWKMVLINETAPYISMNFRFLDHDAAVYSPAIGSKSFP